MARRWTCRHCKTLNTRTSSRTCVGCGKATKPKLRTPKHRAILQDGYAPFVKAAEEIHGVYDESCCVCGKPRSQERHHDRDHDHITGLPRGLACAGNQGCNALMPRWLTAARARAITEYLERVEGHYAQEDVA